MAGLSDVHFTLIHKTISKIESPLNTSDSYNSMWTGSAIVQAN